MAQYIDKDAVLAIIEQLKDEAIDMEDKARWFLSAALTKKIEALEVKDVDLKEEVERFAKECGYKSAATIDFQFAKHFFELGLKARQ